MRITDILTEDKQLDELNLGKAVGKAVGGVAKGIGAVAGGIAGIPAAVKKGFQAGKKTVAGDDEPAQATAPATGTAPAQEKPTGVIGKLGKAVGDFKAGMAQGAADVNAPRGAQPEPQQAAPTQQPAPAAQPQQAAPTQQPVASPTLYAQVKSQIDQLDKKGKQRILQFLQKSSGSTTSKTQTLAATPASGNVKASPTDKFDPNTGEMTPSYKADLEKRIKATGQNNVTPSAHSPSTAPSNQTAEPATKTGQAAIAAAKNRQDPEQAALSAMKSKNPNLAGTDEPTAKQKQTKKIAKKPSQAEIDAERDRLMGNFTDSKNYQNKVRV